MGVTFNKTGTKLFVWEKSGKVYLFNWNTTSFSYTRQTAPVIDLSEEVGNWGDHGLMGVAVHPNFESNGLIYLYYVVDRHHLLKFGTANYSSSTNEYFNATIERVTRYKTTFNTNGEVVADAASRFILIGETKTTGIPITHDSHAGGGIAFGSDTTLLISAGDGASYSNFLDSGSNPSSYYQQALLDGIIRTNENRGAYRAQMINSFSGKILRIDPITGDGIPGNPFYQSGSPRSPQSRVWAMGFRNPFRFSVKPNTGSTDKTAANPGQLYVGDVGNGYFEELNIITAPGQNCGWPVFEGIIMSIPPEYNYYSKVTNLANYDEPNPLFGTGGCTQRYFNFQNLLKQATADNNTTVYNPCNTSTPITGTIGARYFHRVAAIDWNHWWDSARVKIFNGNTLGIAQIGTTASGVTGTPFRGNSSSGGCWYTGSMFPSSYQNTYFMADYGSNWIKNLTMDPTVTDKIRQISSFATGFSGIIQIVENPLDGSIYTVDISSQTIHRIIYGNGNLLPAAKITADKTYGPSSLTVNFSSSGSRDPEGGTMTYSWNFGDGTATSTLANPSHTFTVANNLPKRFVVYLTVKDNQNAVGTDSMVISVNNTPPAVSILNPVKNSYYIPGPDTTYTLQATVTDAEHSSSQLFYKWQVFLRHNNHEHAEPIDTNKTTSAVVPRPSNTATDTYYLMIRLAVTDAAGLTTHDSSKVFPAVPSTSLPNITIQPLAQNACEGVSINFTSGVSDSPLPSVQWQVSTNKGSSWTNINGATSATYTIVCSVADSGKQYRAIWTNNIGSSTSNSAALSVKVAPAAPTGASTLTYCYNPTVADLTANGSSLKWYNTSSGGTALTGTTALVNGAHYYATQTVNGCESNQRLDVTVSINTANSTVTLDGSSSTGTISNSLWTLVSGPNQPTITQPSAIITTVTGMVKGVYLFRLSLNNGASTSNVQVNVNPDSVLSAHAGFDRTITLPTNSITLDGNGSTGAVVNYEWVRFSGPGSPTITSPNSVSTSVTGLVQGNHAFILSVKDKLNNTLRDTVTITVNASSGGGPPVINARHTSNSTTNSVVNTLSSVPAGALLVLSIAEKDNGFSVFNSSQAIQPSSGTSLNDGKGLEIGMKFRSSEDGYITAIRFYKPTNNDAGTHTGELYTSTGTRLGQVAFTNETASGWQQANLSTPVLINKNTTYVVAYHCTAGNYHGNTNFFQTSVASGPLTGLADGTDGPNGVYIYSATPSFPNSTYAKSNYWVDVVFTKAHATVSSSPALTWTKRVDAMGAMNSGNAEIHTARFAAGGNVSVTTTWSNGPMSASLYSISGYDTTLSGGSGKADLQTVPSVSITTTKAYSTLIGVTSDRNAVNGSGRTYRDAASETYYHYIASGITGYHYYKSTASAGSYTEGLTSPIGMSAGTAFYEVPPPSNAEIPLIANAGQNRSINLSIPPSGATVQSFCGPSTISNLTASGNQIKWYSTASGGSVLAAGTVLVNGAHYYASQTINGCESVQRLDVTAKVNALPPSPSISELKRCDGASLLYTNVIGQILWSTGSANDTILVKTAGSYTLTVTDISGCSSSSSYQVTTSYNGFDASVSQKADVMCHSEATGSLTVSSSGPFTPFTYSLDNATYQPGNVFSDLTAGNYVIYVKDASGCIITTAATITQPLVLQMSTSQTNIYGYGDTTGAITINVTGGNDPYSYRLEGSSYQFNSSFTDLHAGNYTVYAIDSNGCVVSKNVTLTQPAAALSISASKSNVLCHGDSTGTITALGSGGNPPYQYKLNNGNYQSTTIFNKLKAGVHSLTIKDSAGITTATSVTIEQPITPLTFTYTKSDVSCMTGKGSILFNPSGGVGSYRYSIHGGATYHSTATFDTVTAGNYSLRITDSNACVSPIQSVSISNSSLSADLIGSASTGDNGYRWTMISGPNSPVIIDPNAKNTSVTGLIQGTYVFELSINNGASKSQVRVNVNPASSPVVADAGYDRIITFPATSYTLNGGGSTGTITSYLWTLVSASNNKTVSIGTPTALSTTVSDLDTGTYVFRLTVANGFSSASDEMQLRVNPAPLNALAPVLSGRNSKTSTSSTVTNTLSGVPKNALLVLTVAQGNDNTVTTNPVPAITSSPALTWIKVATSGAAGSGNAGIWRAVYPAGGKISVTSKWGANPISATVYSITGYDSALNGSIATASSQAAVNLKIQTVLPNSLLLAVTSDRKAVSGTGRTYLDNAIETNYFTKSGVYTGYHYYKSASVKNEYSMGLSKPTGNLSAGTVLYEVKGVAVFVTPVQADAGNNQTIACPAETGATQKKDAITELKHVPIKTGIAHFTVYPNPSSGLFHVALTGWHRERLIIEVADMYGRIVMRKEIPSLPYDPILQLDLKHLSKGVYSVSVKNSLRKAAKLIIKD